MLEVDENIILEANTMCCAMGDINNSFAKVLTQARTYKDMGLTPIYFLDTDTQTLYVKIKETHEKKLN
jgi:hypothetical protein